MSEFRGLCAACECLIGIGELNGHYASAHPGETPDVLRWPDGPPAVVDLDPHPSALGSLAEEEPGRVVLYVMFEDDEPEGAGVLRWLLERWRRRRK